MHRRALLRAAATLTILLIPGTVAPATSAHGTATGATVASCLHDFPNSRRIINANHPTGTTNYTTYLAAGVQSARQLLGGTWEYLWRGYAKIGSDDPYWIRTTRTYFPKGLFKTHSSSPWYRSTVLQIGLFDRFTTHRVRWQIKWPDGHRTYVYSQWVTC
jgi:hypothetical protein